MHNSKRQIALSSILAMLLYLVPNMVQDVHRVFGHHHNPAPTIALSGIQLHNHHVKCPVCVFEFNFVDQVENSVFKPDLRTLPFLFASKQTDQVHKITFSYYNLRGPPEA